MLIILFWGNPMNFLKNINKQLRFNSKQIGVAYLNPPNIIEVNFSNNRSSLHFQMAYKSLTRLKDSYQILDPMKHTNMTIT